MDHSRPACGCGHPAVSVDVVIFTLQAGALHVLLVRRRHAPCAGVWAIPGGLIRPDEPLEAAARRELEEETGVRDVYLEQLYTFGDPARDPRGRVISVAYFALIRPDRQTLRSASAAADVGWFPVDDVPQPLAFDHQRILAVALDRLRSKLEYTTLAFQLLPEVFTLPELKQIYEQILGERLDRGNFYRKIKEAGVLEPVGRFRESGGRPAALYRFRAERRAGEFVFRWREARLDAPQGEG
ncbi:NUDIX domain-containing protein [Kallotenue papyrolyticum]|uniref:NUDIX domain-containing protein n=1 Tax=Kallotenue papyrolyticum TaxID=1325125 RepID=UPI0004927351|nr:NUDIX hydrolase [Kallotenue papyrolyticum]